MRQLSKVYDYSKNFIADTQTMATALHKVNKNKYDKIFKTLCEKFPELKQKLEERASRVVIGITSYSKRYEHLIEVLESLQKQTYKPYKIVLTLTEADAKVIPNDLVNYLADNQEDIEILLIDTDIKPHKKYYFPMQKYRDYCVITVDDDVIYNRHLVEKLMNAYLEDPSRIYAGRVHRITFDGEKAKPYKKWLYQYNSADINPSHLLFATGIGGILYPPDCFDISEKKMKDIKSFLYADDIYLKKLEIDGNLRVCYVPGIINKEFKEADYKDYVALYKINVNENKNDEYLSRIDFNRLYSELPKKDKNESGVITFKSHNAYTVPLKGDREILHAKTMVFKSKYVAPKQPTPGMVFKVKPKS